MAELAPLFALVMDAATGIQDLGVTRQQDFE
jgi:hypothetical protein